MIRKWWQTNRTPWLYLACRSTRGRDNKVAAVVLFSSPSSVCQPPSLIIFTELENKLAKHWCSGFDNAKVFNRAVFCWALCLGVYVNKKEKSKGSNFKLKSRVLWTRSLIHCYVSLDVGWPGNLLLAVLNGMDYFCVGTVHILSSYFVKWNKSTSETTRLLLSNWAQRTPARLIQILLMLFFWETFGELWLLLFFLYIHVCLILLVLFHLVSFNLVTKYTMDIVTISGWLYFYFLNSWSWNFCDEKFEMVIFTYMCMEIL